MRPLLVHVPLCCLEVIRLPLLYQCLGREKGRSGGKGSGGKGSGGKGSGEMTHMYVFSAVWR